MNILIINGPNLNLLGKREASHYGDLDLDSIEKLIREEYPEFKFTFIQSNHEGKIIDLIQNAPTSGFNGLIINPGGYTHSSVAIRDALDICKIPKIEVHLSNLSNREDFRKTQITTTAVDGYISGFKELGYLSAIYLISKKTM